VFSIVDPPTPHRFDISSVFPVNLSVGRRSIIVNNWLPNPFSMKGVGWKIFLVVMFIIGYHEVHGIWPF